MELYNFKYHIQKQSVKIPTHAKIPQEIVSLLFQIALMVLAVIVISQGSDELCRGKLIKA